MTNITIKRQCYWKKMSYDDRLKPLMDRAKALTKAGKAPEAIALFQQALAIEPDNTEILRQYAKALAKDKQFEQAFAVFEKALEIEPDNIDTLRNYGTALDRADRYDKAFYVFKKAVKVDPRDVRILYSYGSFLKRNGDINQAVLIFDKLLQVEPNNPRSLNSYANALVTSGQHKKASILFNRSLKVKPNNSATLNSYANALATLGQYEKAFALFEQSLQSEPNNPITLNSYANILATSGQYEKAFDLFEQSLQSTPNNSRTLNSYARTLNSYANILAESNQYEKALELFERSLQIKPNSIITLTIYGKALSVLGNYQKAIEIFERCLEIKPSDVITLSGYINTLLKASQYETAIQASERLLSLEPDNVTTLIRYGRALAGAGIYHLAAEVYQDLLVLEPNNAYVLGLYGLTLNNIDAYEGACSAFGRYLQIKPDGCDSYICLQYALALEGRGDYQKAIDQLKSVDLSQLDPYQANVIRLNLGRLHYRMNSPEKGIYFFEEAIANSDDSDDKERTLLHVSRTILASDPRSETAMEMLQQIRVESSRYSQAQEILRLNLSDEEYFEMVKTGTRSSLSDTEVLNRAMYHKIANEISVLKGIAYRIVRQSEQSDPLLNVIIQDIETVFSEVDRRRTAQKNEIKTITLHDENDYRTILSVIAKTANDISDFVNNELAVIEIKTRRVMRSLQPEDTKIKQFEQLLGQLELTQSALSDLKAINEGITIKKHRFQVKKLFEKWVAIPQIDQAQVFLDIQNGDSEFNGDEEKIKSALNELIENSLKHNAAQQNLTLQITSQDVVNPSRIRGMTVPGEQKYLFIEFTDNGKGVPPEKKDWIFQPLNTTSSEGKGSGLGLFIIRRTFAKMNGYIEETGYNGARFELYFPYKAKDQ